MTLDFTGQKKNPSPPALELIMAAAPECATGGARPLVQAQVPVGNFVLINMVRPTAGQLASSLQSLRDSGV